MRGEAIWPLRGRPNAAFRCALVDALWGEVSAAGPHPPASRPASPTSWARRHGRFAAGRKEQTRLGGTGGSVGSTGCSSRRQAPRTIPCNSPARSAATAAGWSRWAPWAWRSRGVPTTTRSYRSSCRARTARAATTRFTKKQASTTRSATCAGPSNATWKRSSGNARPAGPYRRGDAGRGQQSDVCGIGVAAGRGGEKGCAPLTLTLSGYAPSEPQRRHSPRGSSQRSRYR